MSLPEVGQPAPDFALPGPDGQTIRLSDYRGRAQVLLTFYPFDFSPTCSMQLPGLQHRMAQFRALQSEVLGISTDSPHSHRAFAAELGLEFPLLSDYFGKEVSRSYGILRPEGFCQRASFIIDKEGILRYAQVHGMDEVPDVETVLQELRALSDHHD